MEENKSIFDIADIILSIISIYIPFYITAKAEKAKGYKDNIYSISNTFHLIRLEMIYNEDKLYSISRITKEDVFSQTKYYGRNQRIYNRKKNYWEKIIINDLHAIKKIDTTLLNGLSLNGKKNNEILKNLTLEIYSYNYIINDIKCMTLDYNKHTLLLDKSSMKNLVTILEKLSYKHIEIRNRLNQLIELAESQSKGLISMYSFPKYYALIAFVIMLLILISKIAIYFIYGINITSEIKILYGIYWFLAISIIIILITSKEIILKI